MSKMIDLSNSVNCRLYFKAHFPKYGCNSNPAMTGMIISFINPQYTSPKTSISPKSRKNCIHNGVMTTPINPDVLALKIAAGIFPRAMETMTTEEDTVRRRYVFYRNNFFLTSVCRKDQNYDALQQHFRY